MENQYIQDTKKWVNNIVIGLNFCPFASQAVLQNKVRYQVEPSGDMEKILAKLFNEMLYLDTHEAIETTLLILSNGVEDWVEYLVLLDMGNELLIDQGYEGVYQLASFHPDYLFDGSKPDDPANYTNRSPYPLLHLIREQSLEAAIASYPNPEEIPENNIKLARKLGVAKLLSIYHEGHE